MPWERKDFAKKKQEIRVDISAESGCIVAVVIFYVILLNIFGSYEYNSIGYN